MSYRDYYLQYRGEQFIFDQGLPNLGNICYINSIVQFLYSSSIFRNKISQAKCEVKENSLINRLDDVFSSITLNSLKVQSLSQLINKIQQINKQIDCFSQQDLFQVLMIILNEIFEEYPSFEDLFSMQIISKCKCTSYQSICYFLPYSSLKCSKCLTYIQMEIIKESSLLLLKMQRQLLYAQNRIIHKQRKYECTGKIFYYGDSYHGHYIASRRHNGIFYCFSDRSVYLERNQYPMHLLYQQIAQDHEQINLKSQQCLEDIQNQSQSFGIEDTLCLNQKKQVSITENTRLDLHQVYCTFINITVKIVNDKRIKVPKKIYFQFIQTQKEDKFYQVQMEVINQDCFVKLPPNIKKKYSNRQVKTQKLYIGTFLKDFQDLINIQIEKLLLYRKKTDKDKYSRLSYERSTLIARYRDIDCINVLRIK